MRNINLYLDDLRPTPEGFERVYDYEEFIAFILTNGMPDFISFDHDLGLGKTGFDCAKWLVEFCLDNQVLVPGFFVHSQNPVGKENIEGLLNNFRKSQSKKKACQNYTLNKVFNVFGRFPLFWRACPELDSGG